MEEKLELIRVWLALAEEKLEVARELLDLSRFDDTVSKSVGGSPWNTNGCTWIGFRSASKVAWPG